MKSRGFVILAVSIVCVGTILGFLHRNGSHHTVDNGVDHPPASTRQRPPSGVVPMGSYRSKTSDDIMVVDARGVRLRQGKSTWAQLPNDATGKTLYDKNDLAKAHPMRIQLDPGGGVTFIREAAPPFPRQVIVFVRE